MSTAILEPKVEATSSAHKSTMQAAVVEHFGKPLVLREWDVPTPGPGQIVVKTEACGVCGTDIHAARGEWPLKPTPPFIPGHEAIGIVCAVGTGVTIVKEGDRVGVPWLHSACGHCEYCLKGWETVCPEAQFSGYTVNGGFAGYVLADQTTSRISRRGSRLSKRLRLSVPALPPTRASSRRRHGLENGSQFPASAASATWQSSTRRRWDCW